MLRKSFLVLILLSGCGRAPAPGLPDDMAQVPEDASLVDLVVLPDLGLPAIATPDDYEKNYARVYNCKRGVVCGDLSAAEETDCEAGYASNYDKFPTFYSRPSAVKAGRLKFNADVAQACINAWLKAGCPENETAEANKICKGVYSPLVMPDGTCQAEQECFSGSCNNSEDGCAGKCKAWMKSGAPCSWSDRCVADQYCSGDTKKCVPRLSMGKKCDGNESCQEGLLCRSVTTDAGYDYRCLPLAKEGEECDDDTSCVAGLFCNSDKDPYVCQKRVAPNGMCNDTLPCQSGWDCLRKDENKDGQCGPFLDVGQPCDPAAYETGCPWSYSHCDQMTKKCVADGKTGSDCNSTYCHEFEYLYCDDKNKCSPQVPLGGSCDPALLYDPCYNSYCDGVTKKCAVTC